MGLRESIAIRIPLTAPLATQEEDNRAPRTITKSDIALFECAKSQRIGIFGIRTFLQTIIAPAARAESREGGNRLKGRAILGGTKGVEVHRRRRMWYRKGHLICRPFFHRQTANEWTRSERTHPIQRSHTPSALSVLDEKFVPHTVGTCLNYSLFKRETKKHSPVEHQK